MASSASIWIVALIAICLVVSSCATSVAAEDDDDGISEWTIALYVNVDNGLEQCWDQWSLPALLAIPDNSDVDIVAWVDRDSTEGYEIVEFSGALTTTTQMQPELPFGYWGTFVEFITSMSVDHPSENLAVIMSDHGSAFLGFCADEMSMWIGDLDMALRTAATHIDILGFDACSMCSMERLYEISRTNFVDIVVASEEIVPGNGFPYDLMLEPLVNDPTRTPVQLAEDMIVGWDEYYGPSMRVNLAAIEVDAWRDALPSFEEWSIAMINGLEEYADEYRHALIDAYSERCTGKEYQVDIFDVGVKIVSNMQSTDYSPDQLAVIDTTLALGSALRLSVISVSNSAAAESCGGLSIYWGTEWAAPYESLVWLGYETSWGDFLLEYMLNAS